MYLLVMVVMMLGFAGAITIVEDYDLVDAEHGQGACYLAC
jgi:hypothetical protein